MYFKENGSLYPLPKWGQYFIQLGNQIPNLVEKGKDLVVVVIVPARGYSFMKY